MATGESAGVDQPDAPPTWWDGCTTAGISRVSPRRQRLLIGPDAVPTVGPDDWVRWFANTLEHAARSAAVTLDAVVELAAKWPARLEGTRSDAAAHRLVDHVITYAALDVKTTASLLDISHPTARTALETLASRDVLRRADIPTGGKSGRPRSWWVAGELLDLLAR